MAKEEEILRHRVQYPLEMLQTIRMNGAIAKGIDALLNAAKLPRELHISISDVTFFRIFSEDGEQSRMDFIVDLELKKMAVY